MITRTDPAMRSRQKRNFLKEMLLPEKTLARRRVQRGSVKIMVRASARGMYVILERPHPTLRLEQRPWRERRALQVAVPGKKGWQVQTKIVPRSRIWRADRTASASVGFILRYWNKKLVKVKSKPDKIARVTPRHILAPPERERL